MKMKRQLTGVLPQLCRSQCSNSDCQVEGGSWKDRREGREREKRGNKGKIPGEARTEIHRKLEVMEFGGVCFVGLSNY